jgi:hypothetical protein
MVEIKCPICCFNSTFIFKSKNDRNIFECANFDCGHFFTPPLNEVQGICDRNSNIEQESDEFLDIYDERNIRLLNLFKKILNSHNYPLKFLDFGAGNAHISRTFKRELRDDCIIYCVESNELCKNLYQKYQLVYIKEISELPDQIDLVYMIEVIEHLADPITVLSGLRNIIKPDGMLFLSTPLGSKKESTTIAYDTPSHLHFFTEKSLNIALQSAGLTQINFGHFPEMYPLPKNRNLVIDLLGKIKRKLNKFIFLETNPKVTHLVGFTKKV